MRKVGSEIDFSSWVPSAIDQYLGRDVLPEPAPPRHTGPMSAPLPGVQPPDQGPYTWLPGNPSPQRPDLNPGWDGGAVSGVSGHMQWTEEGEDAKLLRDSTTEKKAGLSALQLCLIVYFFSSGGPFGVESAVGAAGLVLAIVFLVAMAFVWALPLALLSAELSLMMCENGGNLIWVKRAFPGFLGWLNGGNTIMQSIVANTLLVVLFVEYVAPDISWFAGAGIKLGFVVVTCVLNIIGLQWLSKISGFLVLLVFAPFIIMVFLMIPKHTWSHYDWSSARTIPKDINWSLLMSTTAWAFGGWDNVGSVAGEVKGGGSPAGRRRFLTGLFFVLPLVACNYCLPLFVGYVAAGEPHTDWTVGYFSKAAHRLAPWLGVLTIAASCVSNFGQYASSIAALARVVWAAAAPGDDAMLPAFVHWSWRRNKTARPVGAIITTCTVSFGISLLPFELMVQVYLILRIINLLCEYAALIRLRYTEPDTPRPFLIPGGLVGAWLLPLSTVGISVFSVISTPLKVWILSMGVQAFLLVTFLLKKLYLYCRNRRRPISSYATIQCCCRRLPLCMCDIK